MDNKILNLIKFKIFTEYIMVMLLLFCFFYEICIYLTNMGI